jgi:hypothetical protein
LRCRLAGAYFPAVPSSRGNTGQNYRYAAFDSRVSRHIKKLRQFDYGFGLFIFGQGDRYRVNGALATNSAVGHNGYAGTYLWADPERDLVGVCLIIFEFDGFDRYDGELTGITIGDSKSVVLDHNNVSVISPKRSCSEM